MRRSLMLLALLYGAALPVLSDTITVEASRDATLIEDPAGALANGSGPALFAGRTAQSANAVRRALIAFDLNGVLPGHAIIESVSVTLFMTPSNADPRLFRLYRVLADWGEGPSSSSGGGGAPAQPGDATWIHTFWDTDFWVRSGGQFLGSDSARLEIGGSGFYTFRSDEGAGRLVQDVRLWSASPDRNFGWILIGDETTPQSVKSFASRESPDTALHPILRITYRMQGEPPLN